MPIALSPPLLHHPAVPSWDSPAAVRAGGGAQLETVLFPVHVEWETLTTYEGAISVSNSRAFGNGGVSNYLEFTPQRAGCADCRLKPGLQRETMVVRFAAQNATDISLVSGAKRHRGSGYENAKSALSADQFSDKRLSRKSRQSHHQPATDPKVDMRFPSPLYFESANCGADGVRLHPSRLLTRPA
jgi:hypothetical protein